jgi:hypothetical protein
MRITINMTDDYQPKYRHQKSKVGVILSIVGAVCIAGAIAWVMALPPAKSATSTGNTNVATRFTIFPSDVSIRIINMDSKPAGRVRVRVNDQWEGVTAIELGPREDGAMPFSLLEDSSGRKFSGNQYAVRDVWLMAEGAEDWTKLSMR